MSEERHKVSKGFESIAKRIKKHREAVEALGSGFRALAWTLNELTKATIELRKKVP